MLQIRSEVILVVHAKLIVITALLWYRCCIMVLGGRMNGLGGYGNVTRGASRWRGLRGRWRLDRSRRYIQSFHHVRIEVVSEII